jgi:hypothetical protein
MLMATQETIARWALRIILAILLSIPAFIGWIVPNENVKVFCYATSAIAVPICLFDLLREFVKEKWGEGYFSDSDETIAGLRYSRRKYWHPFNIYYRK